MRNKKQAQKKVLVAMSGGVDSSVCAYLLKEAGYHVEGAYMKQWDDVNEAGVCTWKVDRRDALRAAAHLDISLHTFDYQEEYKQHVFSYMIKEYKEGRTPNPDIFCNKYIKFGFWLKKAKELGFDYLATGHYAGIRKKNSEYALATAKDTDKDQTYFLHAINGTDLASVLFPLGSYSKKQIRAIAKKIDLPTAFRKESMGICFIGNISMKDFLQEYVPKKKGKIVTKNGETVGMHDGVAFYTIGQRHFGVANSAAATSNEPLCVLEKNLKKNELVVGPCSDPSLYKNTILVQNMNWIEGKEPSQKNLFVRFRHRQPLEACSIIILPGGDVEIHTKKKQQSITPGQFAVFYTKDTCLGGGTIA